MPHTDSAWKRMRKTETRRRHNRTMNKTLKATRRETTEALAAGDAAKATEAVQTLQATLDRAATKGYIHKNKAARLKSRLVKRMRAAAAAPPPVAKAPRTPKAGKTPKAK